MNRPADPAQHLLLLAGGGHSHAVLLQRWLMRPRLRPSRTRVMLVNRHSTALYSGMVPAVAAGLLPAERACIDLRWLCRRAGVDFVQAEITGLDPAAGELWLAERPPLRFDRLSLDVGAITPPPAGAAEQPVKPLDRFLQWVAERGAEPVRIRGGGAAAVELALALRSRGLAVDVLLRGDTLRLGSAAANRCGQRLLQRAGIAIRQRVGTDQPADLACTGSRAPGWLAASGLPVDAGSGRVLTEPDLTVVGQPRLFASGDCGLIASAPRPPSGVWAVRAAPLLAENLRRSIEEPARPLRRWRPQRLALQLLGDGGAPAGGDGQARLPRAMACYGPVVVGPSHWLWRWKDWIDQRFIAGFTESGAIAGSATAERPPMAAGHSMAERQTMAEPQTMACRGCAAKLAAAPLASALARLSSGPASAASGAPAMARSGGVPAAEDAVAIGRAADGALLLQSVDGFPALLEDPWLNARLTTLHACSDLWASGAAVSSVQALVTLPACAAHLQEELLLQTLAGIRSVLDPLGAPLLGGHTLEGRDGAGLSLALTVNGVATAGRHWPKGPLPVGAVLLLSRPIGSGVLFAAAMAGATEPAWLDGALETMQGDQAPLVDLLARHGCLACTDVTGFGLLGHLGEMLSPTTRAVLDPLAIPALPGALPLLARGHASSLAPSNATALALLEPGGAVQLERPYDAERLQLMIDPQTCGPLLAALPAASADAALEELQRTGFPQAAIIGTVQTR